MSSGPSLGLGATRAFFAGLLAHTDAALVAEVFGTPWLVADLDGNGTTDFATTAGFFANDGFWGFTFMGQAPATLGSNYQAAASDVNGDGLADILVCNRDNGTALLYLNAGGFQFTLAPGAFPATGPFAANSQARPHTILARDFDGDGSPDLLILTRVQPFYANQAGIPAMLLNNGAGVFSPAPLGMFDPGVYFSGAAALLDFDGDGDTDIVLAGSNAPYNPAYLSVRAFTNNAGSFTSAFLLPNSLIYPTFLVGDFNGDGIQDLVAADTWSSTPVHTFLGSPAGLVHASTWVPTGQLWNAVIETNGDGRDELLIHNHPNAIPATLTAGGSWTVLPPLLTDVMADQIPVVLDLEGDGDQDLILFSYWGIPTTYRNTGLGTLAMIPERIPLVAIQTWMKHARINQDDFVDLAGWSGPMTLARYLNDGRHSGPPS